MARYGNDYGGRPGFRGTPRRGGGPGGGGQEGAGGGWQQRQGWQGGGYDRGFRSGPGHPGSEYGGYGADTGWSAWENPGRGPDPQGPRRGGGYGGSGGGYGGGYDRGFGGGPQGGRGRGGPPRR